MDPSNGYERVAAKFLAHRGRAPSTAVGATHVRNWAHAFPRGAAVLDSVFYVRDLPYRWHALER
jgi:hypothetical protein